MCLATPMEIINIKNNTTATVKQSNVKADIDISLLENPKEGDYVIVHAGFAIEILDYTEAQERLKLFTKLAEIKNPARNADTMNADTMNADTRSADNGDN